MDDATKYIIVKGAREHNLKNVDLTIPKNKLIVFTGVSGSGKSSLAFNTIYAEGQRRYMESLSAYARQFLGNSEKPDVDSIEGLSPAISIDQKTTSNNPRSTVGTVTEIYDYLRLLYARVGLPYCINGHGLIKAMTIKEMIKRLKQITTEERIEILSPVVIDKKGTHYELFLTLRHEGFLRVKVNNHAYSLDDDIQLDKNKRHNIDIVVDRIKLSDDDNVWSNIHDSLEKSLKYSKGLAKVVLVNSKEQLLFSQNHACNQCNFTIPELEPRLFSFNAPMGACSECKGIGIRLEVDEDLLFPNRNLSINQGGIEFYKNFIGGDTLEWQKLKIICKEYGIDLDQPIKNLSDEQINYLMYGSDEQLNYTLVSSNNNTYKSYDYIEGVASIIERRFVETVNEMRREYYRKFMSDKTCWSCKGARLNPKALCVKVGTININEFTNLDIDESLDYILSLKLSEQQQEIAKLVINELVNRLSFLNDVGLRYLNLSRPAQSLSGGEAQRIRLATQIGSKLTGVLYVLDEPSIGLHQKDNDRLIKTLKSLRDLGNTVIVVEHDEDMMHQADWLVDIGPKAGKFGGEIIAVGTMADIIANEKSITGRYLSHQETITIPKKRRSGNGKKIIIIGARENNLKNIDVTIPLGKLIVVTGVSGSGKSTLVNEVLYKNLLRNLGQKVNRPGKHQNIKGMDNIDKVVNISQEPIGRTPHSNPATYTSVFDDIRDLFAAAPLAKTQGYLKGRFSFNVRGGRCERCQGAGIIKIAMHFLPDVFVTCEICEGMRYNDETLQVKYKGKNIYDVLNMSVIEAQVFFANIPKINVKLQTLLDVGMGYIKLGQPTTQLSGGEAQRVKLATYLQKRATGKTLFILDEPTTGLHIDDVKRLLSVLSRIVNNGDTVLVIEHNLDVIKLGDYIIDLGPNGGKYGGEVIVTGTPEQVINSNKNSYTAEYLRKVYQINDNIKLNIK
ncbi:MULTISPECIES: excinuclease ABC subunit UvrA [unclassified Spiroplasma]|uniref:excinuclease ABC subunit UvrA n=1 Tax=unclassified Spiroplasma TaxID=2637901 RepID=UPI0030D4DA25